MKAFKIILAVLLLIALLPASGCVFEQVHSQGALEEEFKAVYGDGLPEVEKQISGTGFSLSFLLICTFVFVLSAAIIAIAWRGRHYGALTSGILVLIPFVWNNSLQSEIKTVSNLAVIQVLKNRSWYANTSTLSLANLLLFLPMVLLLIIGVVEMICHFVKRKKCTPSPIDSNIATDSVNSANNLDIDNIKKYKELLDAGIISQEEFDAKKKQLLDL